MPRLLLTPRPPTDRRSARLARIRGDLLDAPYQLCTSKASLLTDYLQAHSLRRRRLTFLRRAHLRAWKKSVVGQSRGVSGPRWAARLHDKLLALYERVEGVTPSERLILHAQGLRHVLQNMELKVYDGELLVGNPGSHRISAPLHPDYGGLLLLGEVHDLGERETNPIARTEEQAALLGDRLAPFWFDRSVLSQAARYSDNEDLADELTEGSAFILTQIAGISHVTPDYPSVLRLGLRGISAEISAARARLGVGDPRHAFYEAAATAVGGAMDLGHRWRQHLLDQRCEGPARQAELQQLAEVFAVVPEHPAQTLHQALQSILIVHVALHQESFQHGISFGRMDQYLQPFYAADLASGALTREGAIELVGCFLAKAAELLPLFFDRATEYFSGLSSASGITLGGRLASGEDAANAVSHVILDAYDQLRLRQPNLHVRVFAGSDPAFLRRCYQIIAGGGGMPALFNDEGVVEALVAADFPREDALNFSIVGCAEWGVPYKSFPCAGAVFVNLPHALLAALEEDSSDLEDLLAAFRQQLARLVGIASEGNNAIERAHADYRQTPLLSVVVGGCIDSGRDVTAGGATFDTSGMQGVGLADVVDSLVAVQRLVFEDRAVTLADLRECLRVDFVGHETLRERLVTQPKHGEDHEISRDLARRLSSMYGELVRELRNGRGGRYLPGFWTMTTHQGFGRRTGALPSGRRAWQPLSNGVSPSAGCERRGPTAVLASVAAVARVGNGYVLNQKLAPDLAGQTTLVDGLVRGFFAQGGLQLQLNVLDASVLVAARENPEKYRDLVVRISGYSAYFNDLTEAVKDEIIARAQHSYSGGSHV